MKNIMVIGKTATGKTQSIREFLLHATENYTIIVHDAIGQIYKDVKDVLTTNGYKVKVININTETVKIIMEEFITEILQEKTVVFLKTNFENSEFGKEFVTDIFKKIIARKENNEDGNKVYFLIDEMQNFPQINNLEELLIRSSACEVHIIMYFQYIEQVQILYSFLTNMDEQKDKRLMQNLKFIYLPDNSNVNLSLQRKPTPLWKGILFFE